MPQGHWFKSSDTHHSPHLVAKASSRRSVTRWSPVTLGVLVLPLGSSYILEDRMRWLKASVVDVPARREMARVIRRFVSGKITVDQFEDYSDSLYNGDQAVFEATTFAWLHYDDYRTERLIGEWKVDDRRDWARLVLYLMVDQKPHRSNSWVFPLSVGPLFLAAYVTMKLFPWTWLGKLLIEEVAKLWYWPFANPEDLALARQCPNPFGEHEPAAQP